MNNQQLQILALIFAAQARVLGMQAQNQAREANGASPAYVEAHFYAEARLLDELSVQAINS